MVAAWRWREERSEASAMKNDRPGRIVRGTDDDDDD